MRENIIKMLKEWKELEGKECHHDTEVLLIEEMAELTKELTKDMRNKGNKEHIVEEISDVYSTLLIYITRKEISTDDILDGIQFKLQRGLNRLCNME